MSVRATGETRPASLSSTSFSAADDPERDFPRVSYRDRDFIDVRVCVYMYMYTFMDVCMCVSLRYFEFAFSAASRDFERDFVIRVRGSSETGSKERK